MRRVLTKARVAALAGIVAAAVTVPAHAASASTGAFTCGGGSIPAGSYSSITVTGFCTVDAGNVHVTGNLSVAAGGALNAAFGGSNLTVGKNVTVGSGAIVVIGCEPEQFICFNDPDQNVGTLATHDTIGMNFSATDALMVLMHNDRIGLNATQSGGGGGVTCNNFPLGPNGPPAYSTWEDNVIGANASISGLRTCWLGFIRNHVARNVNYSDNVLADPDGNEIVTNTIGRNLNCSGNDPAPQVGDSGGSPNVVGGHKTGQCVNIS